MIFPVSRQLMQFDVFPKVVTAQKEVTIRVRSIGKMRFNTEGAHAVEIFGLDDGDPVNYPAASARSACRVTATPEDDTTLVFTHTFPAEQEYFIRLLEKGVYPETRWVEGSNFVDIGYKLDERTHRIVAMGAIDNLVKGAAGQAVQNMNLLFGLPENTGLQLVPMFP